KRRRSRKRQQTGIPPRMPRNRKPNRKTMTLEAKTLKVCTCNRTVAIDAAALGAALKAGAPLSLHHQLCRKDAGAFQAALGQADEVVVGCTQEAPLFGELAAGANAEGGVVNLREHAGWAPRGERATPRNRALLALRAVRCR